MTGTSLATAAGGHLLAGGRAPSEAVLAALGSSILVATLPLARRRLRSATLLPLALVAQVVLHLALAWAPTAEPAPGFDGHHATGLDVSVVTSHASPGMLLTHLCAVLATVVVLLGAERAAHAAAHWWAGVRLLLASRALPEPAGPVTLTGGWRPRHAAGHGSVRRRGPPVALPV